MFAYLVGVRNVDRVAALRDVAHDTRAPRYAYLVLLLHLHECALRADVKQLRHERARTRPIALLPGAFHQEQRAAVGMQEHRDILQNLVAQ